MIFDDYPGSWFAIQVRSRREFSIEALLKNKGYMIYTPRYKSEPSGPARTRSKESALLPGYIFCRFDSTLKGPIVTTPGVIRIVGFGKPPHQSAPRNLKRFSG